MFTLKKDRASGGRALSGHRDNQWIGLVFVAPFLIGFVVLFVRIMISGLQFAFSDVSLRDGLQLTFNGWDNFYYALRVDPSYLQIALSDLRSLITSIPLILVFSLFVAVILNKKVWGRTAFRAIFFLPVIVSTGLLSKMDTGNFVMTAMNSAAVESDTSTALGSLTAIGDISVFLQQLNFSPTLIDTVSSAASGIMDIINRSGVQILIFLAGIQSIPTSVYESASVEGATAWETFWKITLPMVSPMLLVNVVYTVIESLTRDNTGLMSFVNGVAFSNGQYGRAAAMSWMYFAAVALILGAAVLIVVKISAHYQRTR